MTSSLDQPDTQPPAAIPTDRRWPRIALAVISALIVLYLVQTIVAARGKSSTFDEPIHALSSHLIVNRGDFRVNPEHPALWKYLPGLASIGVPVNVDLDTPAAIRLLARTESQWPWGVNTLYPHRGQTDTGERLVARQRTVMILFALSTILVTARWAWTAAGPTAAVLATALLTLDPNFIAHGTLVTNDIAATFIFTLAAYLTWRLGMKFSLGVLGALVLCCALAIDIKYTCILLAPMVMLPLLIRAAMPLSWPACRGVMDALPRRLIVIGAFGIVTAVLGIALLWPAYRFRYAPTYDGKLFDAADIKHTLAHDTIYMQNVPRGVILSEDEVAARIPDFKPGLTTRVLYWIGDHHLVPQGWSYGMLFAQARSVGRPSFMLGKYSDGGSPWYFPVTILFKTPTGTLLIGAAALAIALHAIVRKPRISASTLWLTVCLLLPVAIYVGVAMRSNLNIGLRHVFPIGPPLFVAAAIVLTPLIQRSRAARRLLIVGIVAIGCETALAFPNDLSFFNTPAKLMPGGPLELLGDSNLDWGQDLPELARFAKSWQEANPARPFYLCYFGSVDPRAYEIHYINALAGYPFDRTKPVKQLGYDGGVLAISASFLQGTFSPELEQVLTQLRATEPYAVINDTIYIYRLPSMPR